MSAVVRYAGSGGCRVRATPGNTNYIDTINEGDLMYDVPGYTYQIADLNGVTYSWVYVHYYKYDSGTTQGNGWVALVNAFRVSSTVPNKAGTFGGDYVLPQDKKLANARYIHNYFSTRGWSNNAIFAMLGNMEEESSMSPNRCNYNESNELYAYGLTQWHWPIKLTGWAENKGYDYTDIDTQLMRIEEEFISNIDDQWTKENHTPILTHTQYKTSTNSVGNLAEYFLRCYEKPGNEDNLRIGRMVNALKWGTLITYLL